MKQYPHLITWDNITQAAPTVDDDGNLIPGTSTKETITAPCRMDPPSGSDGVKTVPSLYGEAKEYAFTVFMPRKEPIIAEGKEVQITGDEGLIGKGPVKRVFKSRFNITLYI